MNTSLSQFCRDTDLAKSSVHSRCKTLGFDTTNGLTAAMVSRLEAEFNVRIAPTVAPIVAPSVAPTVETAAVVVGNHAITLSAPQLPAQYSLENLRVGNAVSFDDPLAVATSFLQTADILEDAMKNDIANRQARLADTQKAKDAISAKRQKLELEARLYQLQTQNLDSSLSAETASLQFELGKLEAFSAPSAPCS